MRTSMRLMVIACAAMTLLAFTAGSASAERAIEIVPGGPITSEGPLRILEPLGVAIIECEYRLRGMLVRQIQKAAAGQLPAGRIGQLVEITARECIDNFGRPWIVTFLVEPRRPVQLLYNAFLGSLPNIEGLLITELNVGVRLISGMLNCLFMGNVPFLIYKSPGEIRFNRKKFLENRLNWVEGMGCGPASWISLEGIFIFEPPQELFLL